MLVVTVTDCPAALKGDLTKWLLEINAGLYVGKVNARIREKIWARVKAGCKQGRAVMVYSAGNEQRLDFKVVGSAWEPIDFDGLKLMMRPNQARQKTSPELKAGFSKAAQWRTAKRMTPAKSCFPESYAIVDLETTGLNENEDSIIEIGAIKIIGREVEATFEALVKTAQPISDKIADMTGISNKMLEELGLEPNLALSQLFEFIGFLPIVSHNVYFDYSFLRSACSRYGLPLLSNRSIDTLSLARRFIKGVKDYKLKTLAEFFEMDYTVTHRTLSDCRITGLLFEKLIKMNEPD